MSRLSTAVSIFFCGDDREDRELADRIAKAVEEYAEATLIDVDGLDRADERGEKRKEGFPGTPVFIVSSSMVSKDYYRAKLIDAAPLARMPGHMAFYICRGIRFSELKKQYPDLDPLFDQIMVGEEGDVDEMLDELQEYTSHKEELTRVPRGFLLKSVLGMVFLPAARVLYYTYYVAFPASIATICFLLISPPQRIVWADVIACIALYGTGFCLNRLNALDFWPWLGRRWRLPSLDAPLGKLYSAPLDARSSFRWLADLCPLRPLEDSSHAYSTEEDLRFAVSAWFGLIRRARNLKLFQLLFLTIPAVAFLVDRPPTTWAWAVVSLMFGFVVPTLFLLTSDWIRKLAYLSIGLDSSELERTEEFFRPKGELMGGAIQLKGLSHPQARQKHQEESWALIHSAGSFSVRRSWFRRRDCAFISYAWADEAEQPVAEKLRGIVEGLEVECFFDRDRIRSKFSAWRSRVSLHLLDCTHVFLVLGRHVLGGQVVRREIQMSVQRWHTEVLPAVICVAEPDVVQQLRDDPTIPPELRFILDWCPRLTYEEAADPAVVEHLLRQRRRQGLFRDWLTLLTPLSTMRRTLTAEEAFEEAEQCNRSTRCS